MAERASYDPITPPKALADYVRLQNQRLFRLAGHVARVQRLAHRVVTASVVLTDADDLVLVDTSGGSWTATLPDAEAHAGQVKVVKKLGAANTLTVDTASADLVEGAASVSWTTANEVRSFAAVLTAAPATWGWVRVA